MHILIFVKYFLYSFIVPFLLWQINTYLLTYSMAQFITSFDRKVTELKRNGIVLPETVLALQLLESVYVERKERQLLLTAVDYSQKETMHE